MNLSMLYQLPNGKVIFLTIDQYLDLTDEDVQYLMSLDAGEHALSPFTDSAVVENTKEKLATKKQHQVRLNHF
jgi:hypothetical protein